MKTFTCLFFCFFAFKVGASDAITIEDLHGIWVDDDIFKNSESSKKFGLSFKQNGDAVIIGFETISCPLEKIKDIDGVFHISCFKDERFEIIRFVVAGWKSKRERILFGFYYYLADTERILNNSGFDDPEKYRIIDGYPTNLVWSENGI